MTAHELARKLLAGPDLMVTVRGYEGGVNEITKVYEPDNLMLNYYESDAWYYGRHEYRYKGSENDRQTQEIQAIHIGT
jgi:hypothetical protein